MGSDENILRWLQDVAAYPADVVLCDFGAPTEGQIARRVFETLASSFNVLVVAAGGNSLKPSYPAWYREVLAVGALDSAGRFATYSYWDETAKKPDIFALGQLEGTTLEPAVNEPSNVGTSFAALHVAAAGILVWATDRTLTARDVRRLIESSAKPLPRGSRRQKAGPRELNLQRALDRVRSDMVKRALTKGPLQIEQLISACALSTPLVVRVVEELESRERIRRTATDGADRYELVL